jgi:hypothetical protein
MPDGASAAKDEMIAGQKDVKKYMANMETYLACIEAEEAQAVIQLGEIDDETARQREEMFNKKYNAAVEEMNLVAEEFNIQVSLRAFFWRKFLCYLSLSISRPRSNLFSVTMRSRTRIRSSRRSICASVSSSSGSDLNGIRCKNDRDNANNVKQCVH